MGWTINRLTRSARVAVEIGSFLRIQNVPDQDQLHPRMKNHLHDLDLQRPFLWCVFLTYLASFPKERGPLVIYPVGAIGSSVGATAQHTISSTNTIECV